MDITKAYSTFVRAVEAGSFSAVARELGISQSAVSKNVAALEESLGIQLFARTTRKLHPTDEALQLYEHARSLLDTLDSLRSSAGKNPQAGPEGVLRLTMPASYGRHRVMPAIGRFLERFPGVKVDINITDTVLDLIEEGLEIGIRIGNLPSNTLVARSLGIIEFAVVASPGYLERHGSPDSPTDLQNHSCIVYGGQSEWHFESEHGRQNVDVSGDIVVNDADAIHQATLDGLGIAQIPTWMANEDIGSGRLTCVLTDYYPIPQPVSIVYPQTRFLTHRARCFIDFMAEEMRKR